MSKHNYTQYSNKKNEYVQPEVTVVTEIPEVVSTVAPVEPVVETATCERCGLTYNVGQTHECLVQSTEQPNSGAIATGTVINCVKLNVRAEPNVTAGIVCALNANSEMKIDVDKSTDEWYKICTATGIEGYCMKKFVDISQ